MNKIFSTTFLILFTLSYLSPTIGSAIDTRTSGRILDNFKAQQADILFESAPIEITDASKILEQEYAMNGLNSLRSRLQMIQSAYRAKKDAVSEVRVSLENALAVLTESIQKTTDSIATTITDIAVKQQKIQQLQSESIAMNIRISEHRSIILSYLANIYSESNNIVDNEGNIDIIKSMILTTNDSDFTLSDITYKTLVAQMGQKFIDEYRDLVRSYYLTSIQTQNESAQLKILKSGLESQNTMLTAQKEEREKLLEITQ
jgi:hypothetical protein